MPQVAAFIGEALYVSIGAAETGATVVAGSVTVAQITGAIIVASASYAASSLLTPSMPHDIAFIGTPE